MAGQRFFPDSLTGDGQFVAQGAYSVFDAVTGESDGLTAICSYTATQLSANIAITGIDATQIYDVRIIGRGRNVHEGSRIWRNIVSTLRIGGTDYSSVSTLGANGTISTDDADWRTFSFQWDQNPATGLPWEPEDLDTIQRFIFRAAVGPTGGGTTAAFELDYFCLNVEYEAAGTTYNITVNDGTSLTDNVSVESAGNLTREFHDTAGATDSMTASDEGEEPDFIVPMPLATIGSPGLWTASSGELIDALQHIDGITASPGLTAQNIWGTFAPPLVPGDIVWVRHRVWARVLVDEGLNQVRRPLTVMLNFGSGNIGHPEPITATNPAWQEYVFKWEMNPFTEQPWQEEDLAAITRVYFRAYSGGASMDADVEVDQFITEIGYNGGDPGNLTVTLDDAVRVADTDTPQEIVIIDEGAVDYTRTLGESVSVSDSRAVSFTDQPLPHSGPIIYNGKSIERIYVGPVLVWNGL